MRKKLTIIGIIDSYPRQVDRFVITSTALRRAGYIVYSPVRMRGANVVIDSVSKLTCKLIENDYVYFLDHDEKLYTIAVFLGKIFISKMNFKS